ncbi:hypothetical protein BDQ12DRAFT_128814 [Crucibulum laeve]|uniref:Uncharacterized protein n=1 Tax=Crucibulum laeve TaxID=68775 RepID=A0A5C3LFI1_9AGAR|nr:hypothetical protein BDQ12DRAFT_128814 [Crucibulum laeve]
MENPHSFPSIDTLINIASFLSANRNEISTHTERQSRHGPPLPPPPACQPRDRAGSPRRHEHSNPYPDCLTSSMGYDDYGYLNTTNRTSIILTNTNMAITTRSATLPIHIRNIIITTSLTIRIHKAYNPTTALTNPPQAARWDTAHSRIMLYNLCLRSPSEGPYYHADSGGCGRGDDE